MAVITEKKVRIDSVPEKVIEKGFGGGKFLRKVLGFIYNTLRNTIVLIFYHKSDTNPQNNNKIRNISEAEIRNQAFTNLRIIR